MTRTGPSEIHGIGVFATRAIEAGQEIHAAEHIGAQGCNHSCSPNTELRGPHFLVEKPDRFVWMLRQYALRPIAPGEEITTRYGGPTPEQCACPAHRAIMRLVEPPTPGMRELTA